MPQLSRTLLPSRLAGARQRRRLLSYPTVHRQMYRQRVPEPPNAGFRPQLYYDRYDRRTSWRRPPLLPDPYPLPYYYGYPAARHPRVFPAGPQQRPVSRRTPVSLRQRAPRPSSLAAIRVSPASEPRRRADHRRPAAAQHRQHRVSPSWSFGRAPHGGHGRRRTPVRRRLSGHRRRVDAAEDFLPMPSSRHDQQPGLRHRTEPENSNGRSFLSPRLHYAHRTRISWRNVNPAGRRDRHQRRRQPI
ncbi:hypothetical protein [Cynomolgus macaque cytomegalovirus strain Mauritius]|uniref:Uncharacterized protein n=1 Tax=Cynomolgus macaque cytomegalovirus strain Mauritius TaxID=1690255 RepID=A0A0K1GZV0_9BETA|nr:hypothetical protein [Cynomolgus macaque cytomegalovirus strain Mauritius]AXG21821.1 hypothetical protein [synthetic construct]AXG22088.1 hypothetical protein [synthetic construct]